jgi:hypothetical protein
MAQPPTATPPPLTEDAFVADRQKFWSGFCSFVLTNVILIVILLGLMAIFLV